MPKTIFVILFWILGCSLNAQVSFYIRPAASMKTQQSFFGSNHYSEKYTEYSNTYFTFRNDRNYFDRNNVQLGLQLGLIFHEKHLFELGLATDNSGVAVGVKAQSYMNTYEDTEGDFFNSAGSTYSQIGSQHLRIAFNYNNIFYKNKYNTIHTRLIVGSGVLHNSSVNRRKGEYNIEILPHFSHGQVSNNVFIDEHYSRVTNFWKNSLYFKFGLGIDFHTKKTNSYLFSFDIYYLQGTRTVQVNDNFIKVIDSGEEIDFHYRVGSRNSGFYFTLSRRFKVYPWKTSKKDKKAHNNK